MKPYRIVLGATGIEITPEPVASNPTEILTKHEVVGVFPVYNVKPNNAAIKYITASGPFALGETITGGTSGATATISAFNATTGFTLSDVVGTFVDGETVTGGTSTETAVIDGDPLSLTEQNEWQYPYPVMTIINITMADQSRLELELQECTNQPTWDGGTLADLNTAVAAINAWL